MGVRVSPCPQIAMDIRKKLIGDIQELVRIKLDAQRASMPFKQFIRSAEEEAKYIESRVAICEIWIAEENSHILGFCAFGNEYLEELFVDPKQYRQGVGSLLLEKAKESCKLLKLTVDAPNQEARLFYESQGFVRIEKLNDNDAYLYEWHSK